MNPPGEDDAFPDEIESAVYNVQYSVIDGVRVRLPKSRDPGARGSVNHYLDCVRLEKKGDDAYGICTLAGCDASFKLSGPNDAPGKVKYSSFITHLKSAHPEELTQDDLEKNAPSVKRRKATDSNDQLANSARSIPAVENKKELTQHLTKLCSNGPFSWNIVNNAAFSEFLIALRVIKAPSSLPSRATVARNFKSNYKDEVLLPLEKLIKASQEVRTVTINTHTFSFRPKVHISVDGWKSPSGDCYLPVAVAGMEQKFYFVGHGKGSPNGTVKIWQPYSQIVAFSKFNPERQNAESYSKSIKEMLSQTFHRTSSRQQPIPQMSCPQFSALNATNILSGSAVANISATWLQRMCIKILSSKARTMRVTQQLSFLPARRNGQAFCRHHRRNLACDH